MQVVLILKNRNERYFKLALVSILIVISSCGVPPPPEYKELIFGGSGDPKEMFYKLPLEKQIEACIAAQRIEPPDTRFIGYLSSHGLQISPLLLVGLNKPKQTDYNRKVLISVLEEIHFYKQSLRNEKQIIESIEAVIPNIKDDNWRRRSEEILNDIKSKPGFGEDGNPVYERMRKEQTEINR